MLSLSSVILSAAVEGGLPVDLPARLVAQVALAWPELTIVVLVARVSEARRLKRQLSRYVPDVDCYHHRDHPDTRCRVAICTYAHAGGGAGRLTTRDIVIAYDAGELTRSTWGRECLEHCWVARLYGLLPIEQRLAPHDRDCVTALFGMTTTVIPAHGRQLRPVEVRFLRIDGGPRPGQTFTTLQLVQQGVWRHPVRNRHVAAMADALANDDRTHRAPELADEFEQVYAVDHCRVVVLAGNVEHALTLARKLPGWTIVCGHGFWADGLRAAERRLLQDGEDEWQCNSGLIATPDGLQRISRVDVLIRADGGTGLPPLSDRVTTSPHASPRLLIVDTADRHHPRLRRWHRMRRDAYRAAGWKIIGEEPRTELDRFLTARPAVELSTSVNGNADPAE